MKKSMSIIGSMALLMGAGYGAYRYYKSHNCCMAKDMKNKIKNIGKNIEDEIDEMM